MKKLMTAVLAVCPKCRLPGTRDQLGAGFAMSMGPPVCQ